MLRCHICKCSIVVCTGHPVTVEPSQITASVLSPDGIAIATPLKPMHKIGSGRDVVPHYERPRTVFSNRPKS